MKFGMRGGGNIFDMDAKWTTVAKQAVSKGCARNFISPPEKSGEKFLGWRLPPFLLATFRERMKTCVWLLEAVQHSSRNINQRHDNRTEGFHLRIDCSLLSWLSGIRFC